MTNLEYYKNEPMRKVIESWVKWIKNNNNIAFSDWLNMEHKKIKIVYYWDGRSGDGCYRDTSLNSYSTQKDCYNDMLKAASKKIIWNVEWEDVTDMRCVDEDKEYIGGCCGDGIIHKTEYLPNKIVDHSYSGDYIWEIKTKEVEA